MIEQLSKALIIAFSKQLEAAIYIKLSVSIMTINLERVYIIRSH